MKRTFWIAVLVAAVFATILAIQVLKSDPPADATLATASIQQNDKWVLSVENKWLGGDNSWYRYDSRDTVLLRTKDNQLWERVKDGTWQDMEGNWLRISNKRLIWSIDAGKTWTEVPNGKWQSGDGAWYRFNQDWALMVKTAR
ncbi:MAG: hypothetical protein AB1458_05485 [Bacteroidota bacterium]